MIDVGQPGPARRAPWLAPGAARAGSHETLQGRDEAPISILLVDDVPSNLNVLETVLEDPAYRLVRANSPEQALLALLDEEFALLILDIRMPGMSGFELAQAIKQRRKTASVPIIFLTAYYDSDQGENEGYGSGAVDFLSKPLNPVALRSKVAVFAELHRQSRAVARANHALSIEVTQRRHAEETLRELNATLEQRVTERTEALRLADRKLHAAINSITDGLMMLDKHWRYTYFNEQGARVLGMRAEELVGSCMWDLFPHARTSKFYKGFSRAVERQETVVLEEFYPEPLNLWLECHCYPFDDGLSVYFHDVTDRHAGEVRREQTLAAEQAARAEGEQLTRAKDEFLATLSHELRTPLAAILGWSRTLKQPGLDAQTLERGIDAIDRNAHVQVQLVNDLLDMSSIIAGKLRLKLERVDMNRIAAAAAETAQLAALAKGLTIELRLANGEATHVMGDAVRLAQIASNLVGNALKFTPAGGTLTITTTADEAHVEFAVSDTGLGIAADFLPRVFDRFSQADGSASRVHGGMGLGLSIVKKLAELHDATVGADSAGAGRGATFKLRLTRSTVPAPAADGLALPAADLSAPNPTPADTQIDLHGVSVLVVDDHIDLLEDERRQLSDCGAIVTTAVSALQAMQCLRSAHFDVLVSDLGMPGIDGYEFIKQVRSSLGLNARQLPAVAVTGYVRDEDHQRALREGYQACLHKPISARTLARAVHGLVQGRDAGAPAVVQARALGARLRALLVEDNLDLQEQIGWLLEQDGADVVACASGEAGEIEYAKGGFDVLVTDVSLPKMTGIELARRVLATAPQAWVIFSTGYPLSNLPASLGPNVRALQKPFEPEDLSRLLEEVRCARDSGATLAPLAHGGSAAGVMP